MSEMVERVAKALFQCGNLINMPEAEISARAAIAEVRDILNEYEFAAEWRKVLDEALK
jgi:hypothetical protein